MQCYLQHDTYHAPVQDIGFDKQGRGGWDDTIINIYFNEHFPKAVRQALCDSVVSPLSLNTDLVLSAMRSLVMP